MMSDEEIESTAQDKADAICMAEALHTIVVESDDPETIRIAVAALMSNPTGTNYLNANPLRY